MSNEKVPGYTVDDVKKLSDLRQARKLLKENHISLEGLQSLWDCKDRLNQYLKKCNDPVSNDGAFTRGADVLQEILQEDKEKRNELLMLYTEVQSYTKTINDSNKEHLKNNVEYYEQKLVDFVSQLQKNDCPILVAGETSSGKSTLLNLILGADILPVSLLSSTSVICELKYGDKKRAVVHKVDGSKTEVNDLGDGEADCLEKLSVYIHMENDREKGSPYNRVEIFWPFPLLRGGLFIVDSPGIGENREMTKQVMEYLPNAFGFIYVINSANAGGVQKDRLQKLLRSVAVSNDGEQLKTFDPRSAIFVCNKWDQVPANEEELVKKDTLDKLRSCWTGLEDEQVFFVSTQKAATSIKAVGFPSSDFDMLLDGIQKLLPISVKYKLQIYYDWLAYLMSRSALQLRTKLYNASMSAVEMADRFKYIQDRLAKCTLDTERVFREIESDLEMRKREIVDSLLHYLKVDCRDAVSHWTEADGPDLKSWDALQKHVRMLILRRLEGLVYEWDGDNMWFQKSRQQLQVDFRKKFGLLQDYLSEVEEAMSVGRSFELKPFGEHDSLPASSGMSKSTKIALGASSPILVPIAVVPLAFTPSTGK
uniref:Mitofusin-2-like n=1 Tax=Saccoglossus kowalevskii TaxID=10224 RepID=A0ABM0M143_SACKO|nr:PREDICTED: mitofusin-2-like [Saccoglossus kowalevskii]